MMREDLESAQKGGHVGKMTRGTDVLTGRDFWDLTWPKYFEKYKKAFPRQAYYVYFVTGKPTGGVLEIGAGSFRDIACLNRWGIKGIGVDFSFQAVKLARKVFPLCGGKFLVSDGFNLCFKDKSFEVSYHNGLFVCFEDDSKIRELLNEQIRVTKRIIICTVHNKVNKKLTWEFKRRANKERLYAIRFFEASELLALMRPFFKRVKVYPFGFSPFDRFLRMSRIPLLARIIYLLTYKFWPLSRCERIMVVGYLE